MTAARIRPFLVTVAASFGLAVAACVAVILVHARSAG